MFRHSLDSKTDVVNKNERQIPETQTKKVINSHVNDAANDRKKTVFDNCKHVKTLSDQYMINPDVITIVNKHNIAIPKTIPVKIMHAPIYSTDISKGY